MIFDKIENLKFYSGIDERFNDIAEFIKSTDLKSIDCGSYDVCDGVTVNIAEYEPKNGGEYEAHRDYHDLQFAITGGERIDVIPISCAEKSGGYMPDIEFFSEQTCSSTQIALDEGTFAFLTPFDAHKPCIKSTQTKIKKAVFKIKINK